MSIKEILDAISSTNSKNEKRAILGEHTDNELLKRVIYLAHSPRVNFYIKQIPIYGTTKTIDMTLEEAMDHLSKLSERVLTGHDGRDHLAWILGSCSTEDAYIIERIIDKNLKIGMDTGYNKVIPKLIEETPYMGAKSFSEKGAQKLFAKGEPVFSQVKADGTYRNAIIQDGIVELLSRQGEVSFLKGAIFLDELAELGDCVLNGELTIDGHERYEANGMASSLIDIIEKADERGPEKTQKKMLEFAKEHGDFEEALANMRFTVWDIITIDEYYAVKSDTPYSERLQNLRDKLAETNPDMVDVVETREITTYEEAMDHFLDTQERGLEGTIIKSSTDGWKDGKPTYQIKMKLEMTMDFRIIELIYGNKGTKNEHVISRLKVESSCGRIVTQPSGMKEKQMKEITAMGDELIGSVVQIRCCGLSQNSKGEWSTMHPSVDELRPDKDTCDSLESALEIQEMAKTLA